MSDPKPPEVVYLVIADGPMTAAGTNGKASFVGRAFTEPQSRDPSLPPVRWRRYRLDNEA